MSQPEIFEEVEKAVKKVIQELGPDIVLGVPLGLGKPNQFINALYQAVEKDKQLSLRIITALSLELPRPKSDVESRLVKPLVERLFGNYVELDYMKAIRKKALPSNIQVSEFYFKAGSLKNNALAQRNYISANYTHVCQVLVDSGVNLIAQLVAESKGSGSTQLSLSCNTDILLDLLPRVRHSDYPHKVLCVGQVHERLPFMLNKAVLEANDFDLIIRNSDYNTSLFSTPNQKVTTQDYLIGLHVSTLIKDGGTLQVGIGSLGDAIVYALKLRQKAQTDYQAILKHLRILNSNYLDLCEKLGGDEPFEIGLYGSSEMLINGFIHLMEAGILKRKVYSNIHLQKLINEKKIQAKIEPHSIQVLIEHGVIQASMKAIDLKFLRYWGFVADGLTLQDSTLSIENIEFGADLSIAENMNALTTHALGDEILHGQFLNGAFFLGPKDFYKKLRDLPESLHRCIGMDSVGEVNQLLNDVPLKTAQRQHARFVNTAMMVTLSGAVVSDALEDGTVISGIGGQYNFVSMAQDLPQARSIICVRSTRTSGGKVFSNIIEQYGHASIPRHLRDIVVTEYGVADLRGKTDEEVMQSLINIADSQFQQSLLKGAIKAGKIAKDYQIPEKFQQNTPEKLANFTRHWQLKSFFPAFPLGSDFTHEEIALMDSLQGIKSLMQQPTQLVRALAKSLFSDVKTKEASSFLERMQLMHPKTAKETLVQHLLMLELEEKGYLRPL